MGIISSVLDYTFFCVYLGMDFYDFYDKCMKIKLFSKFDNKTWAMMNK